MWANRFHHSIFNVPSRSSHISHIRMHTFCIMPGSFMCSNKGEYPRSGRRGGGQRPKVKQKSARVAGFAGHPKRVRVVCEIFRQQQEHEYIKSGLPPVCGQFLPTALVSSTAPDLTQNYSHEDGTYFYMVHLTVRCVGFNILDQIYEGWKLL